MREAMNQCEAGCWLAVSSGIWPRPLQKRSAMLGEESFPPAGQSLTVCCAACSLSPTHFLHIILSDNLTALFCLECLSIFIKWRGHYL